MFVAEITLVYLTLMQRRVLITEDINTILFENIERIRPFICRTKPTNHARTTNVSKQLYASKGPLNTAKGQDEVPIERCTTTNTNLRSIVGEEDDQDIIGMEPRRRPNPRRPTTRNTSHSNAGSTYSSHRIFL